MEPEALQQVDRTWVIYKKRKYSYFAGCDYFRLSSHPSVLRAFQRGLKRYGLSVAASRMTTGNHLVYRELERELAGYFGSPDALVAPAGYMTNVIVAQALKGTFSGAVIDEKAHPSLQDAARFLECAIYKFKHCDSRDLKSVLGRAGGNPILLTDGLFSQGGQIAPLREYLRATKGMILLDDAHGAGVLGKTGRGTPEYAGVGTKRIIQTLTLSKAFGAHGGAILCDVELRDKMVGSSPMFAGSTPMLLPVASAAIQGVRLLRNNAALRKRLVNNVAYAKSVLRQRGFLLPENPAPILSIVPESEARAAELKKRLIANRVFPSFIRYPGGAPNGYFRFVISSEHSRLQIDGLLEALAEGIKI